MNKVQQENIIRQWEQYYQDRNVPTETREVFMAYVRRLVSRNVPIIFDGEHLSMLLGIKYSFLKKIVYDTSCFYHSFLIPKHSGGKREISAPCNPMKQIQRWISVNILRNVALLENAHAFRKNRSILTNIKPHLQQDYLLKIDLKDFFPSIKIEYVVRVFLEIGYTREVSYYLGRLCCKDGCLPQGAPTSPMLCNIVSRYMDSRLSRLAAKNECVYTRYADDIAISGSHISEPFVKLVEKIIQSCGFEINKDKEHLYGPHGKKILTGISLATGVPKLPKSYKRKLRQELYYIETFGIDEHLERTDKHSPYYMKSIIGKLNYWHFVEPDNQQAIMALVRLQSQYMSRLRDNP